MRPYTRWRLVQAAEDSAALRRFVEEFTELRALAQVHPTTHVIMEYLHRSGQSMALTRASFTPRGGPSYVITPEG